MPRHLVLVGGGHAHLTTLSQASRLTAQGHRVTLVSPVRRHHYSGMGPGMLAGMYTPRQISFDVEAMAKKAGADFVAAKAVRVDPDRKVLYLDDGRSVGYDVCSMNVGSLVPWRGVTPGEPDVFPVKPLEHLVNARKRAIELLSAAPAPKFVVAGGGAAGFEISCALARLARDARREAEITVLASPGLLHGFNPKVRDLGARELGRFGVRVLEGARLATVKDGKAVLDGGGEIAASCVFLAWGVEPPGIFRDSGLEVDKYGALRVNAQLRCPHHPEIFGGGDCVSFIPKYLEKVGVYAVRQNRVLYDNLKAALANAPLSTFDPGGAYLLIFNLGDGRGLFFKGEAAFTGRWAFILKNYIDQRFIRRFGGGV